MTKVPTQDEVYAIYREDLPAFFERGFSIPNAGKVLKVNWHHMAIANTLNDVQNGACRRALINSCPRSAKSTYISVLWVAYLLGHDPTLLIIVVSHNMALANELSQQFRAIVNSDWYKKVFPHMSGKPDVNNESVFKTSQGGGRIAVSIGSGVTGLGADLIIIDDPIDTSDANNPNACENHNQWIAKTLMTRLNDKVTGRVVVVMQRISIFDTTAFLLGKEEWHHLCLPAKTDKDVSIPLYDGDTHEWKKGELLHPEFLPETELLKQKTYLQDEAYSAQYLQKPVPSGGGGIDMSLFKRHDSTPKHPELTLMTVDAASGSKSGSRTAIQVWKYDNGHLYLVALGADYWEFYDIKSTVMATQKKYNVDHILIEKASSGLALLEVLDQEYPFPDYYQMLVPVTPHLSKVDRMAKAMIMVAQGRVSLPKSGKGVVSLEQELMGFPEWKPDDQVDALSQVINFIQRYEIPPPQVTVTLC